MSQTAIATLLAIATSFYFLLSSPTTKHSYHSFFISTALSDNVSVAHHLRTLTRRPHVAGSEANAEAAAYVLSVFTSCNIQAHVAPYHVSLTYPVSRTLSLTRPPPADSPITFTLRQEIYDGDPYADVANQVLPTFHGYAKSGNVMGPAVYVNYGRVEDYATLKEMGVDVSGSVVLARYGEIYRGDIVHNAYEAGAIGALIYTDRKDYGGGGHDTKWFPDDKWMPPSGVQVGSVYDGAGDPTTPGWASSEGCERLSYEEVEKAGDVPLIPSLPISAADGETIMRSIDGKEANKDWQGDKDAPIYRVGPGPGVVNLSYTGENVIATIQNVIGVIAGTEEPDRFVILGNHRDAWTFGAVDPNSGTAALLEVAERLQKLQKRGSTEWVEENREILASRAVAYLNVDSAVHGAGFRASATPQLDELLKQATQQVQDPDNSSQTIYEAWVGSSNSPVIGRLGGGGSDYGAFVQHIGVPAADISFGKGAHDNRFLIEGQPHFKANTPAEDTQYTTQCTMTSSGWKNLGTQCSKDSCRTAASVWGLVALRLADEEFLPFNYLSYAYELQKSAKELEVEVSGKGISLSPLFKSIKELSEAATKIENQKKAIEEAKGWVSKWKRDHFKVRELNDRLMMAERAFTDRDGLFRRPWYKHLIYAPSKHNDYGSKSFPGIDDAIEEAKNLNTAESWYTVQHEVWRVSRTVRHASLVLNGVLT
ncbi:hypothetical protein JRO89_XS04G0221800 [Xanthoceras sorbifolium]|uniref:Uncharacterized protein n=1 Tax=Xanthoceras sorbifolium TaxID=99658 RepID=A0ABQ8I6Z5_9ROSI|nr:hypothetical protein JRO89_XS04G0221800 [Xanthoceras sorbifolium]